MAKEIRDLKRGLTKLQRKSLTSNCKDDNVNALCGSSGCKRLFSTASISGSERRCMSLAPDTTNLLANDITSPDHQK